MKCPLCHSQMVIDDTFPEDIDMETCGGYYIEYYVCKKCDHVEQELIDYDEPKSSEDAKD